MSYNLYLYMYLYTYLFNVYLFYIYSYFMGIIDKCIKCAIILGFKGPFVYVNLKLCKRY